MNSGLYFSPHSKQIPLVENKDMHALFWQSPRKLFAKSTINIDSIFAFEDLLITLKIILS